MKKNVMMIPDGMTRKIRMMPDDRAQRVPVNRVFEPLTQIPGFDLGEGQIGHDKKQAEDDKPDLILIALCVSLFLDALHKSI